MITTTTPMTEVITTTQPRESCTTTTFRTVVTTTTTQQTERTVTTTQPTQVTTTTRVEFRFASGSDVPSSPSTSTSPTTAAGPDDVRTVTVAGEPDVDVTASPGDPESDTVRTLTEPEITSRDGDTTQQEVVEVVPALPLIDVTREDIAPLVVETETAGAPIVTTDTRSTGETCYRNPATAEQRRNTCTV